MNDTLSIPITIKKNVPSPWKVRVPARLEGHTQRTSLRTVPPVLPLWMFLFRSHSFGLRAIAMLLILALNATGLAQTGMTAAYFFDEETSTGNTFVAGIVDFSLTNSAFTPTSTALNLAPGTSTGKIILATMNDLANPTQYYASSTNFSGDSAFCTDIQATMGTSSPLYDGRLISLFSATSTATASMTEPWTLALTLPATSTVVNSYCAFDTDFNGWQTRHDYPAYPDAFHDTETVSHRVTSWGLRINKVYYDVDESEDQEEHQCLLRSPGYWLNHEGCTGGGNGSSLWTAQIHAFSSGFSGHFASVTGNQICKMEHVALCPSGGTLSGKRCRAQRHLLANELNAVSGKLDLDALIAGTDDGDYAFDRLGLSGTSTIRQAIAVGEAIVKSSTSTSQQYIDAGIAMERLYTFYENKSSTDTMCVYDAEINPGRGHDPANEWVELYNQTNQPVDINGWGLCDAHMCDNLFAGATSTIPPHGYAVITGASSTFNYWNVPDAIVRVVLPDGEIGNTLDNDAELLLLKRTDGSIIDQMNYGTATPAWPNWNSGVWDPGVPDADEGHMLARVPSGYDTDQPSDWRTLVPPHAELIYPTPIDMGLNWNWGDTYDITWTATNPNGSDAALFIDLFYIEDIDGSTSVSTADRITVIASSTANDGVESWTVPYGFIGWVWVKLVATGPENPLTNTTITSGRIFDPPAPLNELWGVEQESQPIDLVDESGEMEAQDEGETAELPTYEDEVATEAEEAVSTSTPETIPTGGSTEEATGISYAVGTPSDGATGTESTETASTTTTVPEETSGGEDENDLSATTTEEVAGTSTEAINEQDVTSTTTETGREEETTSPTTPPPVSTEESVPDQELPPAPVETEAREEDVNGGVTTPEVPREPDPVPPPPAADTPSPESVPEAPLPPVESTPVPVE